MVDAQRQTERLRPACTWTMVWACMGLGMLFWFLDSVVDAFLFHDGNLLQQLFVPAPTEIWMRVLVLSLLLAFGLYAQRTLAVRRRAEEALRESEQRLSVHLHQTPLAALAWDLDFRAVEWNPAASR